MKYAIVLYSPWTVLARLKEDVGLHKGDYCELGDAHYKVLYRILDYMNNELNIVVVREK